jgi:hypothetical protein
MVLHVVITDSRVFISDELQITIGRRLITGVSVSLLPYLTRVGGLVLPRTRWKCVIFTPPLGVDTETMHFLFVLDTTSIFVSVISHRHRVLVSEIVAGSRPSHDRVKESLFALLDFKSATGTDTEHSYVDAADAILRFVLAGAERHAEGFLVKAPCACSETVLTVSREAGKPRMRMLIPETAIVCGIVTWARTHSLTVAFVFLFVVIILLKSISD